MQTYLEWCRMVDKYNNKVPQMQIKICVLKVQNYTTFVHTITKKVQIFQSKTLGFYLENLTNEAD